MKSKPSYQILASILSADFSRLGEEAQNVLAAGANAIHFDVMDNHYTPNLTLGPIGCEALRKSGITAPIDVHLMTRPVDNLIAAFAKAGASAITIHPEATDHLDRSLQSIKDHGCRAGLALNPSTPLNYLEHVLDKLDLILVMSVNPGFGGQTFIPSSLNKIQKIKHLLKQHHTHIPLMVDGGVKIENIREIAQAGAEEFVLGSAIFLSKSYQQTIAALKQELDKV